MDYIRIIDNTVQNKPNYGEISQSIDNTVKTEDKNGYNWGEFGKNFLGNMDFSNNTQEAPIVSFQPTMMQPQYLSTNFQNQASNIARNNLYNALMR